MEKKLESIHFLLAILVGLSFVRGCNENIYHSQSGQRMNRIEEEIKGVHNLIYNIEYTKQMTEVKK